jgi:hypothetical protein
MTDFTLHHCQKGCCRAPTAGGTHPPSGLDLSCILLHHVLLLPELVLGEVRGNNLKGRGGEDRAAEVSQA